MLLLLFLVYAKCAYAGVGAVDDDVLDPAIKEYYVDSTERLVLGSISLFFAVCLSFVSSIIACCVYTEDRILRDFASNGIKLEAKVVEYTLTNSSRREYTATIDYRYNYHSENTKQLEDTERDEESIAENVDDINFFATIIRKRIKCVDSDLVLRNRCDTDLQKAISCANMSVNERKWSALTSKRRHTTTQQQQHNNNRPQSICIEIRKDLYSENDEGSCNDENEKFPSFDYAIFNPPKQYYVDIVVLPEHPTSAIGYRQLMHSLNRFPIIVLITSLFLLTYFCIYIAIINYTPEIQFLASLVKSFAVLVALLSTEFIILTLGCHKMINEMLSNEYKLHGDDSDNDNYLNYKTEDETLYTMPSSFGGTGIGGGLASTASTSWKVSSPNLGSLQMKQEGQSTSAPTTPLHQMEVLSLDNS